LLRVLTVGSLAGRLTCRRLSVLAIKEAQIRALDLAI
jgi:hypothetical protein